MTRGKTPWLVYAPDIRHEALYARLDRLFALMEKAVGTSRGILTAPETGAATATEIRRRQPRYLCPRQRHPPHVGGRACRHGLRRRRALRVLRPHPARRARRIRRGRGLGHEPVLKARQESFSQLCELHDRGLLSGAELRQWCARRHTRRGRGGGGEGGQGGVRSAPDKLSRRISMLLPNGLLRKRIRTWKLGNNDVPSGRKDAAPPDGKGSGGLQAG